MKRFILLAATLSVPLLLAAWPARAQNGDETTSPALFRIYYSPYFDGVVEKSPADPDGKYKSARVDKANKVDLEVILFGYIGLSVTRIPFYRTFKNSMGQTVEEHAEIRSGNLTLYARESRHNAWNLFVGTGVGHIDEYRIKIDGARIGKKDPLLRDYSLRRNFAGLEYTFDRLGIRYEFTQNIAERKTGDGRSATLEQTIQYLTFYIPLN